SVLNQIFDEVCEVSMLDSRDTARLAMMKRPELGVTFTKLHCWRLTHYSKCVFMDADTL
ncbi:glycogenin-1 isoform X2, partial [Clarias magur]